MDSSTRRPAPDARAMRTPPEPETVTTSLFPAERSNGGALRRRQRQRGLSTTGTFTAIAPATVEMVTATPALSSQTAVDAIRITALHALERTVQHVNSATIGVVGLHAPALAEWLRRTGRTAEPVTVQGTHADSSALASRRSKWPAIVAVDCIEYAPDPAKFLRELKRALNPEGRLVAVVPNLTHASSRLAMLRGHNPLRRTSAGEPRHAFTASEIEGLLDDLGFAVLGIERELDRVEILQDIGAGVPEAVLAVLADDVDALTTHFAILAGPHGASTTRFLHRRVRELAAERDASARALDQLVRRVTLLEARQGDRVETVPSPSTASTPSSVGETPRPSDHKTIADVMGAITRVEEELRHTNARVSARDEADTTRDEALRHACEPLRAAVGELKSTIAQIEKARYRRLVARACQIVNRDVARGSIVAVISRGDHELLAFDRRHGWHFPQTADGVYAGHHPADSTEAIAHLEQLRAKGARYLLIPRTAFWWLDHYREFNEHLLRHYRCVHRDDRSCALFALGKSAGSKRPITPPPSRVVRRRPRRAR